MFDLTGMTALVTGASGGLGSAIAKALAAQGARLAVSGSNVEKLERFRAELGGDHVALPATSPTAPRSMQLVPQAVEALGGKLDILINNAGVTRDNLLMRMKDEEFEEVIRINLEAAFRLMRAAARPMMKARFGRIISITSVVGVTGNPGPGELCRVQGGADRHDESGRAGAREPRHHRQRGRARLHDFGDDRCAQRAAARRASCRAFRSARWAAATTSARPASTSLRERRDTSPARRFTSMAAWRCSKLPVNSLLLHSLSLGLNATYIAIDFQQPAASSGPDDGAEEEG